MRSSIYTAALAAALLTTASADAHSRSFAWFFAHSGPNGTCSGQHVVASYYVSGRRTASGQAFSRNGYTAAHRTLPFGSRVTVTNTENGGSVTVVINDRGPLTRGVTLDLAVGAAQAIGMTRTQWVCMNQMVHSCPESAAISSSERAWDAADVCNRATSYLEPSKLLDLSPCSANAGNASSASS
jgi:rare lipoprotein A